MDVSDGKSVMGDANTIMSDAKSIMSDVKPVMSDATTVTCDGCLMGFGHRTFRSTLLLKITYFYPLADWRRKRPIKPLHTTSLNHQFHSKLV